jgi:hypothetical protein
MHMWGFVGVGREAGFVFMVESLMRMCWRWRMICFVAVEAVLFRVFCVTCDDVEKNEGVFRGLVKGSGKLQHEVVTK